MSEVPICQARANVMTYDDINKKWIPSGSSPGLSKVQIYQHTVNNTFRVVGRKLQDHEVVINCAILKNLKYNQATPTFHQWRDSRHVYGLNFANKEDSEIFANAMLTALDTLNNQGRPMPPPSQPPQVPFQSQYIAPVQPNGPQQQISEDNRTSRPEFQTHKRYPSGGAPGPFIAPQIPKQEPVSQPPQPPQPPVAPTPPGPPQAPQPPAAAPPAPPAPAAPPAPPAPGAPPAPPPPAVGGAPPAPPPPPVAAGGGFCAPAEEVAPTGLTAALQAAKLNKLKKVEQTSEGESSGGLSTSGRPPVMGGAPTNLQDELAQRIAKRANKANTEEKSQINVTSSSGPPTQNRDSGPTTTSRPWEKPTNGNKLTNGTSSPKLRRRNPSLTGQEHLSGSAEASAISSAELETLKQEILTEMRKEMNKMKLEILEAIRDSTR